MPTERKEQVVEQKCSTCRFWHREARYQKLGYCTRYRNLRGNDYGEDCPFWDERPLTTKVDTAATETKEGNDGTE